MLPLVKINGMWQTWSTKWQQKYHSVRANYHFQMLPFTQLLTHFQKVQSHWPFPCQWCHRIKSKAFSPAGDVCSSLTLPQVLAASSYWSRPSSPLWSWHPLPRASISLERSPSSGQGQGRRVLAKPWAHNLYGWQGAALSCTVLWDDHLCTKSFYREKILSNHY